MTTRRTTTIDALGYWLGVMARVIELHTLARTGQAGDVGAVQIGMLGELAVRAERNCIVLARSLDHDTHGGLRERMTVALVNHATEEDREAWEAVPYAVRGSIEYFNHSHGHLSDDYGLHS